jgi:hypothetical protein
MGIFDKIDHAIFGGPANAAQAAPSAAASPASPSSETPASPTATTAAAPSPSTAPAAVDVAAILDQSVASSRQKLDWRHSIVDLMKALKMDATLAERRELAGELHYTGYTQDTATMNMWLHKALMKKLACNGGKVPADLTD